MCLTRDSSCACVLPDKINAGGWESAKDDLHVMEAKVREAGLKNQFCF